MFKIIKNTFETGDALYKCAKLESDYYSITFGYMGDYNQDKKDCRLEKSNITIVCKPKKMLPLYAPIFKWYNDEFLFKMPPQTVYTAKELKELQESLNIAINEKTEIENIFFQFFPKDSIV